MKEQETIRVYADFNEGKTVCICLRSNKLCNKPCQPEIVVRDKFRGWQAIAKRDRYGL